MEKLKLTKKDYIVLTAIIMLSCIIAAFFLNTLGKKDLVMLFVSTFLLLIEIYIMFKDRKLSILLFISSFPVLVTARRAVYFDFLIFKVTYETIYITLLFIINFKEIVKLIKAMYYNGEQELIHLVYTVVFVIFALNSSIFYKDILRSMGHAYIAVVIPVMFALCLFNNFNKHNLKYVVYAIILQCDLSCLYGIFQIAANKIPLTQIASNRLYITFGFHNINIFAGIVILVLPFILNELLYNKNSINISVFLTASLILCTVGLYITFTRGAWLAFFLSALILLLSKRYKMFFYALGLLCIAFIKPAISFILRRGTNMDITMNESSIARLQSLYTSIVIILKYPFGIGGGNFAQLYKKYLIDGYYLMPKDLRDRIIVASYSLEAAHNLWLQIATEFGVICALIFLVMIINRLIHAVKNFKNMRAEAAAIFSYLIFSVLTGVEFEHKGIITATIIIWIVFVFIEIKRRKETVIS